MSKNKRPTDPNKLGKFIVDIATGEIEEIPPGKNPHAVALGRKGGLKGGKNRAKNLSSAKLSEIGKKGAEARWGKKDPK